MRLTQRHTTQGELVGFVEPEGTDAWLGVPYAEPPVGPLRWKAPRPGLRWEEVRQATRFGALCPQLSSVLSGVETKAPLVGDEDCLTLSLFGPALPSAEDGAEGALPEWPEVGEEHFLVLDTDAGGGLRLERGAQALDALEERVWNDASFSAAGRCEAVRKNFFEGFAASTGGPARERLSRHQARCPGP